MFVVVRHVVMAVAVVVVAVAAAAEHNLALGLEQLSGQQLLILLAAPCVHLGGCLAADRTHCCR